MPLWGVHTVHVLHVDMQCFRVAYHGISHVSLVVYLYTHKPSGKCLHEENTSDNIVIFYDVSLESIAQLHVFYLIP